LPTSRAAIERDTYHCPDERGLVVGIGCRLGLGLGPGITNWNWNRKRRSAL